MRQMRFKQDDPDDPYASDIARMRADLNAYGMDASASDIRKAWERFSETMAAGWMLYDNDVGTLLMYLEPDEPT